MNHREKDSKIKKRLKINKTNIKNKMTHDNGRNPKSRASMMKFNNLIR